MLSLVPIAKLGLGFKYVLSVKTTQTMMEAMNLLAKFEVSALAVVDEHTGRAVSNLSATDFKDLSQQQLQLFHQADYTVGKFLASHQTQLKSVPMNVTVGDVTRKLIANNIGHVWVLDNRKLPVGIVSLTGAAIMSFIGGPMLFLAYMCMAVLNEPGYGGALLGLLALLGIILFFYKVTVIPVITPPDPVDESQIELRTIAADEETQKSAKKRETIAAVLAKTQIPRDKLEKYAHQFDEVDRDGSGEVSFREIAQYLREHEIELRDWKKPLADTPPDPGEERAVDQELKALAMYYDESSGKPQRLQVKLGLSKISADASRQQLSIDIDMGPYRLFQSLPPAFLYPQAQMLTYLFDAEKRRREFQQTLIQYHHLRNAKESFMAVMLYDAKKTDSLKAILNGTKSTKGAIAMLNGLASRPSAVAGLQDVRARLRRNLIVIHSLLNRNPLVVEDTLLQEVLTNHVFVPLHAWVALAEKIEAENLEGRRRQRKQEIENEVHEFSELVKLRASGALIRKCSQRVLLRESRY